MSPGVVNLGSSSSSGRASGASHQRRYPQTKRRAHGHTTTATTTTTTTNTVGTKHSRTSMQVIDLTDSDESDDDDENDDDPDEGGGAGAVTAPFRRATVDGGGNGKAVVVPLFISDYASDEDDGESDGDGDGDALGEDQLVLGQMEQDGEPQYQVAEQALAPGILLRGQQPDHQQQMHAQEPTQEEGQGEEGNSSQREPEADEVILDRVRTQILEIVPDVSPDYLLALLLQLYPEHKGETANFVITMLFDDPQYPKVDRKGKRKSEAAEGGSRSGRPVKQAKIEYIDYSKWEEREKMDRPDYVTLTVEHLQTSFPYVPRSYLRKKLGQLKNLYAPAHIHLTELYARFNHPPHERPPSSGPASGMDLGSDFPFLPRKTPYRPLGVIALQDPEFDKEKLWVALYDELEGDFLKLQARWLSGDIAIVGDPDHAEDGNGKGKEKEVDEEEDDDNDNECPEGEGIECGCCFTEYAFEKMIQCPEAHLFCKSCVKTYASNLLGSHDVRLKCMHQSGCCLVFPESELRRVLPQKLIDLYDRLKQQKEIEEADLEGLEECPFCDYKLVIEVDNTQERLFRCGNFDGGCGAVSCRQCKRLDHIPKSCKEMDEDNVLDGQHVIEEAMTAALMRSCPKCKKPFIKEYGCNKITCNTCGTASCYVCRKIINGYGHFNDRQGNAAAASSSKASSKCPLWEAVETRHAQEVKDAAEKAIADFRAEHPDIDAQAIKVDVPKVPPPAPQPTVAVFAPPIIPPQPIARAQVRVPNPPRVRGGRRGRRGRQPVQPVPPAQPAQVQPIQHIQPIQPAQPAQLLQQVIPNPIQPIQPLPQGIQVQPALQFQLPRIPFQMQRMQQLQQLQQLQQQIQLMRQVPHDPGPILPAQFQRLRDAVDRLGQAVQRFGQVMEPGPYPAPQIPNAQLHLQTHPQPWLPAPVAPGMAAVPQAQAFRFHAQPADLNQNLNPNPVQAQNPPARRQTRAGARLR